MKNSLTNAFNPLTSIAREEEDYISKILSCQINEIIGSYHHRFDHFYEAVQNAVDACEFAYKYFEREDPDYGYFPEIKVIIDLNKNSLTVIDNGLGMKKEEVQKYFFTPHATIKKLLKVGGQDIRQRGEKGVGATFLSYGSNLLHLTTLSYEPKELVSAKLEGGLNWALGLVEDNAIPEVIPSEEHKDFQDNIKHGTAITIKFSENANIEILSDISNNWEQWKTILKLFTAIGSIDFDKDESFFNELKVNLKIIKEDNKEIEKPVETGYFFPHLASKARVQLNKLDRDDRGNLPSTQRDMNILWENFSYEQVSDLVTSRMERTNTSNYYKNKISQTLNEYKPEAYVAFTYASEYWDMINQEIWSNEFEGRFKYGLLFSTKAQKIGEIHRIEFKFRTGDFNRFFILLNMKNLKADIGRKSLKEEINYFGNYFANSVQDSFNKFSDCLTPSPGPFSEEEESELENLSDEAINREDLPLNYINFKKVPKEEQDVVALFFNLLGIGKIKGYALYSTHISRTYDGIGNFDINRSDDIIFNSRNKLGISEIKFNRTNKVSSPKRCFIEFKYSTDQLVKDIRSGYKRLQDIKWLICWEIGNKHKSEGIGIIDITEQAQINHRDYYGITHLMTESQDKVYVICLKKVIEILGRN